MIEELRIRCLGVIDDAVLEFSPGLTVVTGETGAGKTMVVTGLGLLLGSRADAGQVRRGADKATVEGSFQVSTDGSVGERIAAAGGTVEDDVAVLVRTVNAQGRSRAHVGGATAPVSVLGELAPALVTVHGQADQQRLLQPARQRELLDAYAASGNDLVSYRTLFMELTEIERTLAALVAERQARTQEADLLRFGLSEIEEVDPQPGEDATLRSEDQRLSHAEELHQAAATARSMLDSDDEGAVNALLARGRRALEAVRDHDPALGAISDRIAEVGYLAADLAADLTTYTEGAEVDPRRLAAIADRRAALGQLTRKYGSSVDDVLQWARTAAQRLEQLDATDDDVQRLNDELTSGLTELARRAAALSKRRTAAARQLEKRVTQELKELAMPDASLAVEVRQAESDSGLLLSDGRTVRSGQDGIDEVTILLRPHADAPAQPLAKGASGGELSRVMLAVEVVLAGADDVPTFVFDEVDAGVGGRAAVEVGRRLAGLARTAQVIVVTHLPQVAAFADRHLVVTKSSSGVVTSSGVTVLDDQGRAKELARMLAGLEDSALGQAHAAELMDLAAADKKARA